MTAALCAVTLAIIFSRRASWVAAHARRWCPFASRPDGRRLWPPSSVTRAIMAAASVLLRRLPCRCCASCRRTASDGRWASRPDFRLLRLRPADPAGHAAADDDQRPRHRPAGVRLVLRTARWRRAAAFALSVLFIGLGIVGNLPGGLLYAIGASCRRDRGQGAVERDVIRLRWMAPVLACSLAAPGCALKPTRRTPLKELYTPRFRAAATEPPETRCGRQRRFGPPPCRRR